MTHRTLWGDRAVDAFNDLVDGKWPESDEDGVMRFRASTKDPKGHPSLYSTTAKECDCQAAKTGNPCRHRARYSIIRIMQKRFAPQEVEM